MSNEEARSADALPIQLPNVDENRLKGNYAAHFVSHLLSRHCLVRPVAEGTDIGVDLYCESVWENRSPGHHFWVQVKGSRRFPDQSGQAMASFGFSAEHLQYWYRQPVPVFAFLVPLGEHLAPPRWVHVIELTTHLLIHPPSLSRGRTCHSDYTLDTTCDMDLVKFIHEQVPYASAAQSIAEGIVDEITQATRGYTQHLPTGFAPKYRRQIVQQLRRTACFALIDLAREVRRTGRQSREVTQLHKLVEAFQSAGDVHYEVPLALACAASVQDRPQDAEDLFQEAFERVVGDTELGASERAAITRLVARLGSELPGNAIQWRVGARNPDDTQAIAPQSAPVTGRAWSR